MSNFPTRPTGGSPRPANGCRSPWPAAGPAVRAEASADNFYAALDSAVTKLEARLRRSADRRHDQPARPDPDRRGRRAPRRSSAASPCDRRQALGADGTILERRPCDGSANGATTEPGTWTADGGPGRVVRIKDHPADPITVDQALFQMELVGHDFYLFNDADTGLPSVVYRRKGFDYGLLRLT